MIKAFFARNGRGPRSARASFSKEVFMSSPLWLARGRPEPPPAVKKRRAGKQGAASVTPLSTASAKNRESPAEIDQCAAGNAATK
jgi:hypothetical protein